jgi:hypothetical protein
MSSDQSDIKINLTRLAVVIGVLAGIIGVFGAWITLPSRLEAAEKKQEIFETRVERRFEATEDFARKQQEVLIRIDENVKELRRMQRANREP